jgi:hypothetical protein
LPREHAKPVDLPPLPAGSPWEWGDLTDQQVQDLSANGIGEPDDPLFQYVAAQTCLALQERIDSGDGRAVLSAVAECAKAGLVMPDWLARAYLKRWRVVVLAKAKSWDDEASFGKPYPKGANLNAIRKARMNGLKIYSGVRKLREQDPGIPLEQAILDVAAPLGIGRTLAQEYFYNQEKLWPFSAGALRRKTGTRKI